MARHSAFVKCQGDSAHKRCAIQPVTITRATLLTHGRHVKMLLTNGALHSRRTARRNQPVTVPIVDMAALLQGINLITPRSSLVRPFPKPPFPWGIGL